MNDLVTAFSIIAVVLIVSALVSGLIERMPISLPLVFLAIGIVLGPRVFGLLTIDLHSPWLETVGTLCLAFVLFLDAIKLEFDRGRRELIVPMLAVGPGSIIVILIVTLAALLLFDFSLTQSLLLGAVLASTDPVVLRDVLNDERIPRSVRRALGIEAGTNDIVILPLLLVVIAIVNHSAGGALDWARFLVELLFLGPAIGFIIGGFGARLMSLVDAHTPVRQEYQALFGVGIVLAAYAAGSGVGGDGFLAAFAAGAAIPILNAELCTCFMDYGETTAEMAMLLAFVLFGALLSTLTGTIAIGAALALAFIVIVVARPVAMTIVLKRAQISLPARAFIAWFGPRGLSSLLFALLIVEDGVAHSEALFAIVGVVVIISVVVHGATAVPASAWYQQIIAKHTLAEERRTSAAELFRRAEDDVPRIEPEELAARLESPNPPVVLDVRSRSTYSTAVDAVPGSIRVQPDQVIEWSAAQKEKRPVVTYCTCPHDATAVRVAQQLIDRGFDAAALHGGFNAWRDKFPVMPVGNQRIWHGEAEMATEEPVARAS